MNCRNELHPRKLNPAWMAAPAGLRPGFRGGRGFTYIGVLVLVAVMGLVLAAAGQVWHTVQRRDKEQELLFVGNQFRMALNQFYRNTPGKARRYPLSLEELIEDPRQPAKRRYLRKIYLDPITRSTKWGLISGPSGEIYGVHSLSEDEPLKQSHFKLADKAFEGKKKYADWVFMHSAE